jgi:hypothetical protein
MPLTLILVAILAWLAAAPAAQAPPRGRNSAAAITGAFADSCRDFAARSSKDISWSLHFGDGTSVSGTWSTAPPVEITHQYTGCSPCIVTLTVTDSAGQSASDVIGMVLFLNLAPD